MDRVADILDEFGLVGNQRTLAVRGLARELHRIECKRERIAERYPSALQATEWLDRAAGQLRQKLRSHARPVIHEEGS